MKIEFSKIEYQYLLDFLQVSINSLIDVTYCPVTNSHKKFLGLLISKIKEQIKWT